MASNKQFKLDISELPQAIEYLKQIGKWDHAYDGIPNINIHYGEIIAKANKYLTLQNNQPE